MIKSTSPFRPLVLRVAMVMSVGAALAGCGAFDFRNDRPSDKNAAAGLTPAQVAPALRLARATRANGDLASAISLYRSVTAIQPADPAVVVELGDTLVDANSMDDAIDAYNRVDQKSPAWLDALLGLEQVYLALAEPAKALEYADKANALSPQDHRVGIGRGVALDMLGRHTEAQECYRAVLNAAPRDVAARNNLALSLAMTKQFDEAIQIMTSMARSSTATPRIRQNLALIYGLAGDAERAAALSRVDLDAPATEANLRFFAFARDAKN